MKQWKNEADQSNSLVSISLPIYTFLWGKKLFFRGLERNFSYISSINTSASHQRLYCNLLFLRQICIDSLKNTHRNNRQSCYDCFKICYMPLCLCDFLLRAWFFLFRANINSSLCAYAFLKASNIGHFLL